MTIGRSSRKGTLRSSIRAPKFLDKSSGFYGRLDEPQISGERDGEGGGGGREAEVERWNGTCEEGSAEMNGPTPSTAPPVHRVPEGGGEAGVFDFNLGMMEDDEEILLRRKPSRLSSRWRMSSRRKQQKKEEEAEDDPPGDEGSGQGAESRVPEVTAMEVVETRRPEEEEPTRGADADDQVMIRDKKRGREEEEENKEENKEEEEEEEEERKMEREQEEGMKAVKRNTLKNYRKALDRAFRRGWESFITNLYSVTLTPITSSSSPSSSSSLSPSLKKKVQHNAVLAEFR